MNIPKIWRSFYGVAWPVAHLLRKTHPTRWLRFHALPDSQRYAQNEREMQEILRRSDLLATEILGCESACLFFFPDYATEKIEIPRGHFFGRYDSDDIRIDLRCAAAKWELKRYEVVLRAVANDEVRATSWMSIETGEIFAPYDGGFDLFLATAQRHETLRTRHKEWLSKHAQGF